MSGSPRATMGAALLALVVVLGLGVGSCSWGEDSGVAESSDDSVIDWGECGPDYAMPSEGPEMECAEISVPLEYRDPDGAEISLAMARLPALGDRSGSIVVNPGGPGASGLDYLSSAFISETLRESFDVVSWDPRGVGASAPINCTGPTDEFLRLDPSPDSDAEQVALDAAAAAVAEGCAESDPEMLPHVHTEATAADLEEIRKALGEDQLNYIGFSYGTLIGQIYADRHGESIRTMVLDGVVDPTWDLEGLLFAQSAGFEATIGEFDRTCTEAGPQGCGVEDLEAAYDTVSARVESEQPATSPATSGTRLGPADLATAAIFTAYRSDGWQLLGKGLGAALGGDDSELVALAKVYRNLAGYDAYAAVMCTDSPHPVGGSDYASFAARASQLSARFGPAIANELLPCASWAAPSLSARSAIGAPEATSVLVVGNTGDPATPFAGAVAVNEALTSSQLLTVESGGHVAYGRSTCATEVVDLYILTAELPPEPLTC